MFILNNLYLNNENEKSVHKWWFKFYSTEIEPHLKAEPAFNITKMGQVANNALAPFGATAVCCDTGDGWNFIFKNDEDATAFVLRWG